MGCNCHFTHNKYQNDDPRMGVKRTSEETYAPSEISTKNSSPDGWALSRQAAISQPRSPFPPEPRRKQLVTVLAVEQLSRHY
jgi:hypothetical protein